MTAPLSHIAIERAPVALAVLDGRGRIKSFNAAFEILCGGGLKAGMALCSRIAGADQAKARACLAGKASGAAVRMAGAAGAVAQLHAGRGAGGETVVCLIAQTGQTDLETYAAQAQKMQAVGQLAGGVAHDFNNLLTAIIGSCDLLEIGGKNEEAGEIRKNAERGAALVRQLLAFSRRQRLKPRPLGLNEAIGEARTLLTRLLGERIALEITPAAALWPVRADPTQFVQILLNLAVNAREAMPAGGRFCLRTANVSGAEAKKRAPGLIPAADYVLCEAADSGPGIAPEIAGRIFEPFFSTRKSGSGLGLATVYGIVKQSEGFIFPARKKGRGAVFHIYLPRHRGRSARARPPAVPLKGRKKGLILLVEDDDAVRRVAARALTAHGFQVLEADRPAAALDLAKKHTTPIDVLVSDVVMPGMNGIALYKRLCAIRKELEVVFMSGYTEATDLYGLENTEKFRFLPKPFGLKQLVAAVTEAMEPD